MRTRSRVRACTFACLVGLMYFTAPSPGIAQIEQHFLFIGDLPYSDAQSDRLNNVIAPAILKGGFPFLVHYGGSCPRTWCRSCWSLC